MSAERSAETAWRWVDLRSRAAWQRGHLPGSASLPVRVAQQRLFMFPPRSRPVAFLASDREVAKRAAAWLQSKGWASVGYSARTAEEIPRRMMVSGGLPERIWEPTPLLAQYEPFLPVDGMACDLACGSGRDTVFLACQGRVAWGVDRLPDALSQARTLAREAGAGGRARFRLVDLKSPDQRGRLLREGRFHIVTCFRFLDRALLPAISRALAPGGWVIVQTFLEGQRLLKGHPRRAASLLEPGELQAAFDGHDVVHYHEGIAGHTHDLLASLVARRA